VAQGSGTSSDDDEPDPRCVADPELAKALQRQCDAEHQQELAEAANQWEVRHAGPLPYTPASIHACEPA
jgi:hypothetical protein